MLAQEAERLLHWVLLACIEALLSSLAKLKTRSFRKILIVY